MDNLTPSARSQNMARIRSRNSKPELAVRSLLHRSGFRFRLHRKDLPGTPDIVLPKYNAAVFVHGCYWHRHKGCKYAYVPKSRVEFWMSKFEENTTRDERNINSLKTLGWHVLVVWECEVRHTEELSKKLHRFLEAINSCKVSCHRL